MHWRVSRTVDFYINIRPQRIWFVKRERYQMYIAFLKFRVKIQIYCVNEEKIVNTYTSIVIKIY